MAGMPNSGSLVQEWDIAAYRRLPRAIADGGASVNKVKVADPEQVLRPEDFLQGRVALLRRGRKSLAAARRPS